MLSALSRSLIGFLLVTGLGMAGCTRDTSTSETPHKDRMKDASQPSTTPTIGQPIDEPYDSVGLATFRSQKDEGFRADGSPIPASLRSTFKGLSYFPAAPNLVFRVALKKFDSPEPIEIAATKGDIRRMLRYGTFSFTVDSTVCTLVAYKSEDGPDALFVPFKDATNGGDTYRVGRYLDFEEHAGDAPYVLDFNLAYNPYCAYNPNYTCPLVPKENILSAPIRAGEKLPPFADH